jgi:hypothetical protein
VQTAIVSIVALGALLFVVRRVVGAIRPPKGQAACPSCASGAGGEGAACGTSAADTAPSATPDVQPLILIRSKTR